MTNIKINLLYITLITAAIALLFSTVLSHITYSISSSSYFSYDTYALGVDIFKTGGVSSYIASFISQSQTLLTISISLIATTITYMFTRLTKGHYEGCSLSLITLSTLYSNYMDRDFAVILTSSMLISLGVILISLISNRGKVAGTISALVLLTMLYFCVTLDRSIYIFIAMVGASWLISISILRRYRARVIISSTIFLATAGYSAYRFNKEYHPSLTRIMNIEQSLEQGNWNRALELSRDNGIINQLTNYYINIALLKTGKFTDYLFYTPQKSGEKGLFLPNDYNKLNDLIYDIIGLPSQALRCTFENYVVYGKNYSNLKRLLYYYNKCGNEKMVEKFSLFLRDYNIPEPSGYITTGIDSTFTNLNGILESLETTVDLDKGNRAAYEVLMAHYALSGRVVKFAELCKYAHLHFGDTLPRYYQEVLLVYLEVAKRTTLPPIEYKIDKEIEREFAEFRAGRSANKYRNTYWYYTKFTAPTKNSVILD